jgi:hypothetical protein
LENVVHQKQGSTIRKGINLKNGGYGEKAPNGSNYGKKGRKIENWWLR